MLSLLFKSKRRECRAHLPRVAPPRHLDAQRMPPATSSADQSFTGPPSDAATSAPHERNDTCPSFKTRNRKLERGAESPRPYVSRCMETSKSAETDELKLEVPIRQEEKKDELHGRKCESDGLSPKKKRKKRTRQLDQQQHGVHQQEKVTCNPSEPERKRNRHYDVQQASEKLLHRKGSKLNKPAPRTSAEAGLRQHQEKLTRHPQGDSNPEHEQEDNRLQLLQQFAARGMSGKGTMMLRERLHGGQFRSLNEFLYTTKGAEALARYRGDPKLFDLYHAGYRSQVRLWPLNPLDRIALWLKKQPKHWIAGDFGCGEAKLALLFPDRKFYSFDLVAANERITACDIANVPLASATLDVAIFCLSLMGRDWPAFLGEAHRVLKHGGCLVIAEVSSRIESLSEFIAAVEGLGFKNNKQEDLASFFVLLEFSKEKQRRSPQKPELAGKLLRPCLYKRR